jgi:hypothetical protein
MAERDKIVGDIFRNNLYSANSIPILAENIGKDISEAFDSSDFLLQSLATQLIIAANIRKNSECFHDISEQITKATWDIITKEDPDCEFSVSFRGKSFISEIHKRYSSVCAGNNPIIKDLLAVRIIILNETNLNTLKKCYKIFFKLISSLTQLNNRYLNFPLVVSEPDKLITSSDFDREKYPDIIVPDIKFPNNFERVVKDYMKYPKKNGYQSLHCSFEIPSLSPKYAGLNMEIQLRTLQQHEWAEYMNASHSKYKRARSEKMDKIFYFDPKKVHMAGYSELSDFCGLCKPIQLCQRHKTF